MAYQAGHDVPAERQVRLRRRFSFARLQGEQRPGEELLFTRMFITRHTQNEDLVERLDPGYWHPCYEAIMAECRAPLAPLHDFIEHITYGAIVTGRAPEPDANGMPLIGQGCLRPSGVDTRDAVRVGADSPWAPARCVVRSGDLLVARSGEGSLAKNRLGVYHGRRRAVVDCFVDLVRLRDIDPDYVAAFLRTRFGWAQIHRLINGVGPSNLNFDEIRSLQVAMVTEEAQAEVARRYADEVLPAHRDRRFGEATEALREIVAGLERTLV